MSYRFLILPILGILVSWTPTLRATTIVPADLTILVAESRAIVNGRVIQVRAGVDGEGRIERLVTIGVSRYFKGDLGPEVTFKVPGGQVGRIRTVVVGAPEYEEGQDIVVFLGARGPSVPYVLGLGQGLFRVVFDAQTATRIVVPPPLEAGLVEQSVARGDTARRPLVFDAFAAKLTEAVRTSSSASDKRAR